VGLGVTSTADLDRALKGWNERPVDLIVLSLHHGAPLDQLRRTRTETEVPIVAILSNSDEDALCQMLEAGADLAVPRPYSARLLGIQVRALLRRTKGTTLSRLPTLSLAGLTLDATARTVQVGKREPCRLTQLEFRLLYTLISHLGQTLPTETIVERVWGYGGEGSTELVRGLVSRLRAKVEVDRRNPQYIQTVPGVGYCLVAPQSDLARQQERRPIPPVS
jgi:DNA-binding response OmpR family regulator